MITPALSIIVFNLVILFLFYGVAVKQLKLSTLKQIAVADLVVLIFVVIVVGLKYSASDIELWSTRWHWLAYTVISYALMEIPFVMVFLKRHNKHK